MGRQSWRDLAFLHWPVAPEVLQPLVPPGLRIDTFGGTSWVGVVPFRMADVAPRGLPAVPGLSAFPELNVRLYVEAGGKPGVWFLSLDAPNPLVVAVARRFFHLPYVRTDIALARDGDAFVCTSVGRDGTPRFRARWRPSGPARESRPGTLEHWLTERYGLYAQRPDGAVRRMEVHHVPWPLQPAEAEVDASGLLASHGLAVEGAPLAHAARRVDVVVWPPEAVP